MNINNPLVIIPLTTLVIAQIVHFARFAFAGDLKWRRLAQLDTQLPALVAVVASLSVTALAVAGYNSATFAVTTVLAGSLISLQWQLFQLLPAEEGPRMIQGYRGFVLMGFGGVVSGALFSLKYWGESIGWLLDVPSQEQALTNVVILATIGVASLAGSLYLTKAKRVRKLPTSRRIARALRWSALLPATVGLFFAILQLQENETLGVTLFTLLAYIALAVGLGVAYSRTYKTARERLEEERAHFVGKNRAKKKRTSSAKKKSAKKTTRKKR